MTNASVRDRCDPTSPHYDEAFAKLRAKAYQSYEDHVRDLKDDPNYRAAAKRKGWDK